MKHSTLLSKLFIAALALILPGMISAAPVGTLDIAGLGVVQVFADRIDFSPLGGGTGTFIVTGTDGTFTDVPLGTTGTITDLTLAAQPPGVPINLANFMVVPAAGPIFRFSLEQILLGGGPSCAGAPGVGQSCTPSEIVPNSPFLLTQTSTGVVVSFSVMGTVTDVRDAAAAPYSGLFSAQLTVENANTVPEVLAAFGPGGAGFVESSWSAQASVVPEPVSFLLIGGGLVGLVLVRRRMA